MITFEHGQVTGWETAIRGMRNPMNSWDKSDSWYGCGRSEHPHISGENCQYCDNPACTFNIGPNDLKLMRQLASAGSDHAKFRRMILVTVDVTAPLYWWKEYDTYKVGTVANSCSTMHKIQEKEFTMDDFSHDHLSPRMKEELSHVVGLLNMARKGFLMDGDKQYWWDMIQMLPSSYNQKRTLLLNYEVLAGIYPSRNAHKLDEWREFCTWITELPYHEIITGQEEHPKGR